MQSSVLSNPALLPAAYLSPCNYATAFHPVRSRGKVSFLTKIGDRKATTTHPPEMAHRWIDCLLDGTSYMSLNRFAWHRQTSQLVELNALYLDLDIHVLRKDSRPKDAERIWPGRLLADLANKGLPEPSILNFTGRGLAAIWLLKPLPAKAHPRWSETNRCLIEQFRHMGADRSAGDCARVFRLPGTINEKSGLEVRCIGGTLERHEFDKLSERIFVAGGRLTRAEWEERKKRCKKKARSSNGSKSGGLPPRQRFRAIQRDLEKIVESWGGQVPQGWRNTFLHVLATSLTHTGPASEISDEVWRWAQLGVSGLPDTEIDAIIRSAERRAGKASSCIPRKDDRLHYGGDRIAELLGISDWAAQTFRLEQVFSKTERARRKAARETQRRRTSGAMAREDWLEENTASRNKPWEAAGMSRASWYRKGFHKVPPEEPKDVRQVCVRYRGEACPGDRALEHTEALESWKTQPSQPARNSAEPASRRAARRRNGPIGRKRATEAKWDWRASLGRRTCSRPTRSRTPSTESLRRPGELRKSPTSAPQMLRGISLRQARPRQHLRHPDPAIEGPTGMSRRPGIARATTRYWMRRRNT